jgi:predicted ArsR family transcriptional regulator
MTTTVTRSTEKSAPSGRRSRRAILDRLKQEGPQDAGTLAASLGISAMAVRQHLYDLRDQGLAAYEETARPLGRPAKLWRLTPAADAFFPDGHAELTLSLLAAMGEAFGAEGMDRLLALRTREQIAAYRAGIGEAKALPERLRRLAALRSEEGYMAAVEKQQDGGFLLVENHCPICAAATACSGLCAAELAVFQAALGEDVTVERTDHILAGARRCAYRVCPKARS